MLLEFKPDKASLVRLLLPRAPRVEIRTNESADELLSRVLRPKVHPAVVLLHIDFTDQYRLPLERERFVRELSARGVAIWNARLMTVSKSAIQQANVRLKLPHTKASADGPATELVIVKTRYNAWGCVERDLTSEERRALGYRRSGSSPIDGNAEYPVLPRHKIPTAWWSSRRLHLERFVSSADAESLRIVLAGQHCAFCLYESEALVRRPENGRFTVCYLMTRQRASDPTGARRLPAHVWTAFRNTMRFAAALGVDYGAIDVAFDQDRVPHIVDVNPTPWGGSYLQPEIRAYLRGGFRKPVVHAGA